MSSHHIVREKQEPALLVLSLENFDLEWLGQLLEWSPTVLTTAAMAEKLLIEDIKIDIIIGDADGLPQADIKFISRGTHDDATAALKYLTTQGYPAVNIITDNLTLDIYKPFVGHMDMVIYNGNKKVIAVRSGYSKWAPAGQTVEILEQSDGLLSTGLDTMSANILKTNRDGTYTLTFSGSYLFIAEQL